MCRLRQPKEGRVTSADKIFLQTKNTTALQTKYDGFKIKINYSEAFRNEKEKPSIMLVVLFPFFFFFSVMNTTDPVCRCKLW